MKETRRSNYSIKGMLIVIKMTITTLTISSEIFLFTIRKIYGNKYMAAEERGAESVVENVNETAYAAAKRAYDAAKRAYEESIEYTYEKSVEYNNLNNPKGALRIARENFNNAKANGADFEDELDALALAMVRAREPIPASTVEALEALERAVGLEAAAKDELIRREEAYNNMSRGPTSGGSTRRGRRSKSRRSKSKRSKKSKRNRGKRRR